MECPGEGSEQGIVPAADRALRLSPPPAHEDRHNAALVTLDERGFLQGITLAGKARLYGEDGLPQPLGSAQE